MDKHEVIIFEDALTGRVIQTINLDYIDSLETIDKIVIDIFDNFYFDIKHNLIIKFGYNPIN